MNCKNCGYGLKQSCGDFEKIICTYEEGECEKITELEKENTELKNKIKKIRDYLAYKIPRELMNEATNKIWNMV